MMCLSLMMYHRPLQPDTGPEHHGGSGLSAAHKGLFWLPHGQTPGLRVMCPFLSSTIVGVPGGEEAKGQEAEIIPKVVFADWPLPCWGGSDFWPPF